MNPVFTYIPNLIGYTRILFALISLQYLNSNPLVAVLLYGLSCVLDAVDGMAARYFGQSSGFGAVLDMVTDRCTTGTKSTKKACLLIHLSTMYPSYTFLIQLLVSLDLSSHYMHMVSSALNGKSHKVMNEDVPYLMASCVLLRYCTMSNRFKFNSPKGFVEFIQKLYYTNKTVLFLVCAGNELCFVFWYCLGIKGWNESLMIWSGLGVCLPVCLFKQVITFDLGFLMVDEG